jgi:hypothetical protein
MKKIVEEPLEKHRNPQSITHILSLTVKLSSKQQFELPLIDLVIYCCNIDTAL